MYLHKESNTFPLYKEELIKKHPNIDNICPNEYAIVEYVDPPLIDHDKERCFYQIILLNGKYKLSWKTIPISFKKIQEEEQLKLNKINEKILEKYFEEDDSLTTIIDESDWNEKI
jgi:hypothetical protein